MGRNDTDSSHLSGMELQVDEFRYWPERGEKDVWKAFTDLTRQGKAGVDVFERFARLLSSLEFGGAQNSESNALTGFPIYTVDARNKETNLIHRLYATVVNRHGAAFLIGEYDPYDETRILEMDNIACKRAKRWVEFCPKERGLPYFCSRDDDLPSLYPALLERYLG